MSDSADHTRGSRRVLTIAAASVVLFGLTATALVLNNGSAEAPASITTDGPGTTTTAPLATELPPLTDSEIAFRVLPLATAWDPAVSTLGWRPVLDGSVAATVPECAPHMAAFESPDRSAEKATRVYWDEESRVARLAYVVVFPDESGARAMFDATANSDFMRRCRRAYESARLAANGDLDYDDPGLIVSPYISIEAAGYPPEGEVLTERSLIDLGGDEQWSIDLSRPSIPETVNIVTVRVGRVVIVTVDGELHGVDPVAEGTYHSIIAGMVARAREMQSTNP